MKATMKTCRACKVRKYRVIDRKSPFPGCCSFACLKRRESFLEQRKMVKQYEGVRLLADGTKRPLSVPRYPKTQIITPVSKVHTPGSTD